MSTPPVVPPTWDDPMIEGGSHVVGGPFGRLARSSRRWWTPARVLIMLAGVAYLLALIHNYPCISNGWASPDRYEHMCYSDIPPLFSIRDFTDGAFPYLNALPNGEYLEYPVLTGMFMWIASLITVWITSLSPQIGSAQTFFAVNTILLLPFFIATVVATAATVRKRPWDAAMVALAPGIILCAIINWDMIPVAFTALAMMLWARKHPLWAGILLGLAISAKFYPLILLGPWLLLAIRSSRLKQFWWLLLGTVGSWLVVNLPFILANFDGWFYFYKFSQTRGQDFGSIWYASNLLGLPPILPEWLNTVATGSFLVLCVAIGVMIFATPRRPRLAQVLFLVVAAFCLTNKVYSPQYVMWLIPLAVMARPRWRDFLIWQVGEAAYFAAVWWLLAGYDGGKGLTQQWYAVFVFVHVLATAWFAAMVIRDMFNPRFDPVRTDGRVEDRDDPGGGCFDGAPDRIAMPSARPAAGRHAASV